MAATQTEEKVIADFRKKHGNRYDYSNVIYINSMIKVDIICKKHGSFPQTPAKHKMGRGCPSCANEKTGERFLVSFDKFLKRANKKHNNKYTYDETTYTQASKKVKIICPKHEEFWQRPSKHMMGEGCIKCGYENMADKHRMNNEIFLTRAIAAHGERYNYSKVVYKKNTTKVIIICRKHKAFKQAPAIHWEGAGCPKCSHETVSKRFISNTDDFIAKSEIKHGEDTYDYSLVEYVGAHEKVIIICRKHKAFKMTPDAHQNGGAGCPKCANEASGERQRYDTEIFIKKSKEKHGDRYNYSKVNYKTSNKKVVIICNEDGHGEFKQNAGDHMGGKGCPKCAGHLRWTTEEFIEKSEAYHGKGRYDYSKAVYVNQGTKITIVCPVNGHGEFQQFPPSHLRTSGCRKCSGRDYEYVDFNGFKQFLKDNNLKTMGETIEFIKIHKPKGIPPTFNTYYAQKNFNKKL